MLIRTFESKLRKKNARVGLFDKSKNNGGAENSSRTIAL